jgi:hypothetical protein
LLINILPKTIEQCIFLFLESTFELFSRFLSGTNGGFVSIRQGTYYSIGKSGGKGCSAGLKNFKVRASNVALHEGLKKSLFQEGIFGNKKRQTISDLPLFFEPSFNQKALVHILPYISI